MNQISFFDIGKATHVRRISYDETLPFILGIHYARRIPCIQYAYGIFDEIALVGVCTYGQPASPSLCEGICGKEYRNRVLELNRLVMLPEYNGTNYGSMLVGRSLKMLPPGMIVVSYADFGGWGHIGYVYQATNWLYTGATKARTDIYTDGHSRHYDKEETRRKARTSKHRYVYFTGSKKDKKELRGKLKYPIKKYPKGDTLHYDVENPKPLHNDNI